MKHFIGKLLLISYSQWLYHNFTLHNKIRGYLHLQCQQEVLKEVDRFLDTSRDNIPQESQYLLELNTVLLGSCNKSSPQSNQRAQHTKDNRLQHVTDKWCTTLAKTTP
jgi:hypothetical protein